jgi:hypothetical protein
MWSIGGLNVLIGIVPGEEVTLRSGGDLMLWRLSSNHFDPWRARPPVVYCSGAHDECREGFDEVVGRGVADRICPQTVKPKTSTKRCMVPGLIRVVTERNVRIAIRDADPGEERKSWDAHPGETSGYMPASNGTYGHWHLCIDDRCYLVVIGPGEKWTVKVEADGRVMGVRDAAIPPEKSAPATR